MNSKLMAMAAGLALVVGGAAYAADRSYQVTAPVVEVTDTKIVLEKEDGKWEIARNAETKVTGDVKVGGKVTVQYTMTAKTITVKEAGKSEEAKEAGEAAKADKVADKAEKKAEKADKKAERAEKKAEKKAGK